MDGCLNYWATELNSKEPRLNWKGSVVFSTFCCIFTFTPQPQLNYIFLFGFGSFGDTEGRCDEWFFDGRKKLKQQYCEQPKFPDLSCMCCQAFLIIVVSFVFPFDFLLDECAYECVGICWLQSNVRGGVGCILIHTQITISSVFYTFIFKLLASYNDTRWLTSLRYKD